MCAVNFVLNFLSDRLNEHQWLQRLTGSWTYEGECSLGPDQPPMKTSGTEVVEPLGALWTIGRMTGQSPDGGISHSIMTLGYDPQQKRFVGSFVASVMTHLWIYNGALDESGQTLILDCEGPSFTTANYLSTRLLAFYSIGDLTKN